MAITLRKEGLTFQEIADRIGSDKGGAQRMVMKYLRQITVGPAKELLEKELLALNDLVEEAMKAVREYVPVVYSGVAVHTALLTPEGYPVLTHEGIPMMHPLRDYSPMLAGISSCMRILERRQKLLGIEAPTRTIQSTENVQPIEFRVIDSTADLKQMKDKLAEATVAHPANQGTVETQGDTPTLTTPDDQTQAT